MNKLPGGDLNDEDGLYSLKARGLCPKRCLGVGGTTWVADGTYYDSQAGATCPRSPTRRFISKLEVNLAPITCLDITYLTRV
jgi:hypothetical protein